MNKYIIHLHKALPSLLTSIPGSCSSLCSFSRSCKRWSAITLIVSACIITTSCNDDETSSATGPALELTPGSIAEFLVQDPRFTVFVELASRSGILNELNTVGQSEWTGFIPTNAAFNALPDTFMVTQNFVSNNNPALINTTLSPQGIEKLIAHHVIEESLSTENLAAISAPLETLASSTLSVGHFVQANGEEQKSILIIDGRGQIIQADQAYQNGTIHVMDTVLIPTSELAQSEELDQDTYPGTTYQLIEATPLFRPFLEVFKAIEDPSMLLVINDLSIAQAVLLPLGNIPQVMAEASKAELLNRLALHTLPGSSNINTWLEQGFAENDVGARVAVTEDDASRLLIDGIPMVGSPIATLNGMVYPLETVLTIPNSSAADLISTDRRFSHFSGYLKSISVDNEETLLDTLRDPGSTFTVFAPTNQAMAKLLNLDYSVDTSTRTNFIDELRDADLLDDVLTYHIIDDIGVDDVAIPDQTFTSRLGENISTTTLGGQTVVLNTLIEVLDAQHAALDSGNESIVYPITNALIPGIVLNRFAEGIRPQDKFPGTSAEALAYFSLLSAFNEQLANANVPGLLSLEAPPGNERAALFGGSLADILRFKEDDVALLKDEEEQTFPGERIAPYAAIKEAANFVIEQTTVFAVINDGFPKDIDQFITDTNQTNFLASDLLPLHVVFGRRPLADLPSEPLPTLTVETSTDAEGTFGKFSLEIATETDGVTVNEIPVVASDVITSNGVIHVLPSPLTPSSVPAQTEY